MAESAAKELIIGKDDTGGHNAESFDSIDDEDVKLSGLLILIKRGHSFFIWRVLFGHNFFILDPNDLIF